MCVCVCVSVCCESRCSCTYVCVCARGCAVAVLQAMVFKAMSILYNYNNNTCNITLMMQDSQLLIVNYSSLPTIEGSCSLQRSYCN